MQSYKFLLPTKTLTKNELTDRLAMSGQRVKCTDPHADEIYKADVTFKPDAAVIDEQLTVKETIHYIEQTKKCSTGAKVIVLAHGSGSERDRYLSTGADAVLPADANAEAVINSLEKMLGTSMGHRISYESELYERVSYALCELGITPNYCGYRYLRSILILLISEPDMVRRISKTVYPKVAKIHGAKPSCIERGVRTAIGRSWKKVSPEIKVKYFGVHSTLLESSPTNSEFIFIVADRIRREIKLENAKNKNS
ncbi:sporulation initiation factor Spo0A C-terminal domain-containing protein [Ruminococcus sp. NK3A76]|uniref:sporulation initiation factor Spo0A C-terminal domain-containing protein n=1 Tax=Ruminococcus sp. NK3A76 TaxID=877411 RepID=UPI00048E9F1D|nr:sporulation initiation factor Spo0A C-terminal domain-containing protein [Ruminococcus sp. NK3A76]